MNDGQTPKDKNLDQTSMTALGTFLFMLATKHMVNLSGWILVDGHELRTNSPI